MTDRTVSHASYTINRVFQASPATVFAAFAEPAAKRRWFVDGEGRHVDAYDVEFVVGGHERSRLRFRDGPPVANDTTYMDIVPEKRIIFAYTMTIDGRRISASLSTIELKPEGLGTRLTYTEQGAFLDGLDEPKQREDGWRTLLQALAEALGEAETAVVSP